MFAHRPLDGRPTVNAWSSVPRRAPERVRRRALLSSRRRCARWARPGCAPRCCASRCRRPSGSRRTPTALSADVTVDGVDISTGRLILLHDPAGNDVVGRHVPLRRLRPRRDRPRDDHRPGPGRRRLVLADRGARGPRRDVRPPPRARSPASPPTASARWPTTPAAPRSRSARPGRRRRSTGTCAIDRPRRGLGRTTVYGGRSAAGPRGRDRHAQSPGTAWSRSLDDDLRRPRASRAPTATPRRPTPYPARRLGRRRRPARPPPCSSCATASRRSPRPRRSWPRPAGARRRRPVRSPSTPSARRATATPPAPT